MNKATSSNDNETSQKTGNGRNFIYDEEFVKRSVNKISEWADILTEKVKKADTSLRENLEKRPLVILGGAILTGYVVGYFMRSLNSHTQNNSHEKAKPHVEAN